MTKLGAERIDAGARAGSGTHYTPERCRVVKRGVERTRHLPSAATQMNDPDTVSVAVAVHDSKASTLPEARQRRYRAKCAERSVAPAWCLLLQQEAPCVLRRYTGPIHVPGWKGRCCAGLRVPHGRLGRRVAANPSSQAAPDLHRYRRRAAPGKPAHVQGVCSCCRLCVQHLAW